MIINKLTASFGKLENAVLSPAPGLNIFCAPNESGKSSAAMFIKFVFYGLSSKAPRGESSERDRCINRLTGQAAGKGLYDWSVKDGDDFRRRKQSPYFDGVKEWTMPE